jgi:nitrate reductase NapAB chaperone NapD
MILSFTDFCSQSEILFEDLARETGRLFVVIASEHYESYLESYRDINNDH